MARLRTLSDFITKKLSEPCTSESERGSPAHDADAALATMGITKLPDDSA